MKSLTRGAALLLVLGMGLALVQLGAQAAEAKEKKADKFENRSANVPLAKTVDFQEALGLDTPSLAALGVKIDAAREAANPVELVLAAQQLAASERVSSKQAKITAAELFKEAAEMAGRRAIVDEIKTVNQLVPGEEDKKTLTAALTRLKERSRGITGTLMVINTSGRSVAIYVNDQYRGFVGNNGESQFFVGGAPYDTTKLSARSGTKSWGPRYISQENVNHTWSLFP